MSNSTTPFKVDVVIAGGGCSGTLTAIQLVRQWQASQTEKPLSVLIVDESERPCRGPAYSTSCGEHLLNVPAKGMSAYPHERDHFWGWLRDRGIDATPETFAPRMVYGDYLEDVLKTTQAGLPANIALAIKKDRVQRLELQKASVKVHLQTGFTFEAATAVLALGNFPPNQSAFTVFLKPPCDGYHDNPWAIKTLQTVRSNDDVFLIGTGLTMIDVALQLRAEGHKGQMFAASRHGYLPQSHFVDDRLCDDGTTQFLPKELPGNLLESFRIFKNAVREAEKQEPGNWRFVMNELRALTSPTWKKLDKSDRKRFLRHVRQMWEVHRHRMAPEIASKLAAMNKSGALTSFGGRITSIKKTRDKFEITISKRNGGTKQFTVQHVINCTGPQTDLRAVRIPVIAGLIGDGLLCADDLGLSARVDDDGALISVENKVSDRLFTIGCLRKGSLWESTAVPEIRDQSHQLASRIINALGGFDREPSSVSSFA